MTKRDMREATYKQCHIIEIVHTAHINVTSCLLRLVTLAPQDCLELTF